MVRLTSPGRARRTALVVLVASLAAACASHPKYAAVTPAAETPPAPPSQSYARPTESAPTPPPVQSGALPGTVQDFVVNVGDRVYFDYNAVELNAQARGLLASQAAWLSRYPAVQVRIEGNCDERGTREYNFALGARRADAVKDFLEGHGVAAARITTVSYGKERPIDDGTGEQAWAHNRNAHTAIVSGGR